LVNHSTYAVANGFNGSGSRVFTHQMAATSFFTMYQILKTYPDLAYRDGYDAKWYLNIAFNIYNQRVVTSTSTGYYGEQFIEPLIAALRAEEMTTEADALQARFTGAGSGKGYTMATAAYPYGSEFPFDNTGEEGAYFSAKALRTYAPDHAQYDRAYQNMLLAEWKTRASRGLQPTWFHYANVVFIGGEGWWNSQYTTPLAAAIMDDYLRFQDNGYSEEERAWAERVNYAAKLSAFSHVNMGQIAPTAIGNISWRYNAFKGRFGAMNVNDQNGNRTQYNGWNDFSGEADENLYGSLLRLSSDVVADPIFGLYGYGCTVADNGNSYTVKPLEGIGKKINLLNEKIYLAFSRDEVSSATLAKEGNFMLFTLNNQTGTDHGTQLNIDGLPEDGKYYVVEDGTIAPLSEFTVEDGQGVAEIAMTDDAPTVNLAIILASDYNTDGPTVLVDLVSKHAFKDAPIELAGEVFNADNHVWSVEEAPADAEYAFTGADTLSPTFVTDTAGTYVIRLDANADGETSYADIELEVIDRADFAAPAIEAAAIEPGVIFPGYDYRLTGEATTGIPDGILTYAWSGSAGVAFSDATAASPTVTFDESGAYTLTLAVTDEIGRKAEQPVNVTVLALSASDPPEITIATIASGKIFPNHAYPLTGSATTGIPDGALAYLWSGPAGIAFSDATAASPTVIFDEAGAYTLTLTVTDDLDRETSQSVMVTVLALSESDPPEITTATIDADAPVVNTAYGLIGMAVSGIPGSDALSYRWTSFPEMGVTFSGTGADSAYPTVTIDIPRTYDFTLTVTDGIGRSAERTFSVVVADNMTPYNVALTSKGATLQSIRQNGGQRTAPLNGGSTARSAANTLNTWGTNSSASRHWFQLTLPDEVTLYGVDIMWSSDGGGTQPPAAGTATARNVLMVPAADTAVPLADNALTVPADNWISLSMTDKTGAAITDIPRATNGTSGNNVWNFAGFEPVDSRYLLMALNRPGSGNGIGLNYWRAYALEPIQLTEDVYVRVNADELADGDRRAEVFPARFATGMKRIDFTAGKYVYLNHDIALKWTESQIEEAAVAAFGAETVVTGTNNTLGYSLKVHVVRGESAPAVAAYSPVIATAEVGDATALPGTVVAELTDGSKQTLTVTWDLPDDVTATPGAKSVSGLVALPDGWTGDPEIIAALTVVEDVKSYLGNILQYFESLDPIDYAAGALDDAAPAYEAAKRIYDYAEALPDEVAQAANALNAAIDVLNAQGLEASDAMLEMLRIFVDGYASLQEADYVASYWAVFADALEAANAVLDDPDPVSRAEVRKATEDLIAAAEDLFLHRIADKTILQDLIEVAEELLEDSDKYFDVAVENLEGALEHAKTVNGDPDASEADMSDAYNELLDAVSLMFEKGDKRTLQEFVDMTDYLTESLYTPVTWASLGDALDDAQDVLADPYAFREEVEAALDALKTAWAALAPRAQFGGLQAAINAAQNIVDNIETYVPSTVAGLADELAAAKLVRANASATQAQVNAAAAALNAKNKNVRLRPNKDALLALAGQAQSLSLSGYTAASVSVFEEAVAYALTVLNASDEDITQATVDAALTNLRNAINALTPLPAEQGDLSNGVSADGASVSGEPSGVAPDAVGGITIPEAGTPLAGTAKDAQIGGAQGDGTTAGGSGAGGDIAIGQGVAPLEDGEGISPVLSAALAALATLLLCIGFFALWSRRRKSNDKA
jgi:PKD repeat protein